MHHGLFTFFVQHSGFRTVWLAGGGFRLIGIAAMSFVFGDFHYTTTPALRGRARREPTAGRHRPLRRRRHEPLLQELLTIFVLHSGLRAVRLADGGYRRIGIAATSFVFGDFHYTSTPALRSRARRESTARRLRPLRRRRHEPLLQELFTIFVLHSSLRAVRLAGGVDTLIGIAAMNFDFGDLHFASGRRHGAAARREVSAGRRRPHRRRRHEPHAPQALHALHRLRPPGRAASLVEAPVHYHWRRGLY